MKKINLVCLLLAALMILSSCAMSIPTSSDLSRENSAKEGSPSATPQPSLPSSGVLPTTSLPSVSPEPSVSPSPSRLDSKDIPDPVLQNRLKTIMLDYQPEVYTVEYLLDWFDDCSIIGKAATICLARVEKLDLEKVEQGSVAYEMTMTLRIQKIFRSNEAFDQKRTSVGDTVTAVQSELAWSNNGSGRYTCHPRISCVFPITEPGYDYIVFFWESDESKDADYCVDAYSPPLSEYSYNPLYTAKIYYLMGYHPHLYCLVTFVRYFYIEDYLGIAGTLSPSDDELFDKWVEEIGYEKRYGKPYPRK